MKKKKTSMLIAEFLNPELLHQVTPKGVHFPDTVIGKNVQ